MSSSYEPVIVGFLCTWCSYRAADLVGMARVHYAPTMRSVKVMCSSRVAPELVIKALASGADGVLILGCHPGGCHYVDGNIKSLRRVALLRQTLQGFGIEQDRLQLVWAAASEGNVVAAAVDRMTDQLRALGPLAWNERVVATSMVGAAGTHVEARTGESS